MLKFTVRLVSAVVLIASMFACGVCSSSPVVIAGSSQVAPPPYDSGWSCGMTTSIDRAFPVNLCENGSFSVSSLLIAAYHSDSLGTSANFSIYSDNNGAPASMLCQFAPASISSGLVTVSPLQSMILNSNTRYWLVGRVPQGQVNWNVDPGSAKGAAYRVNGGSWVYQADSRASAFAILGSPVPEPSSILALLAGIGGMGGMMVRKRSA